MQNFDPNPVFINSILKVTAHEDIHLDEELTLENNTNSTIEELLKNQKDAEKTD